MFVATQPTQLQPRVVDGATASALLSSPWAINEQGRQQVIAFVTQAMQGKDALPLRGSRVTALREGGVAVIPIVGPLVATPSWFALDYETILKDFTAAIDDKEVKAIVFDVDSPGGMTAGCAELSAAIFAGRRKKPVVAYVGGACCSAAYWIGSAAGSIVASQTAIVGSIGCYASLVDSTELLGQIGLKEYKIANAQSPYKIVDPAKAEDRDRVRAMVTQLASVFIADVARNRAVGTDTVEAKFGKGDVVVAGPARDLRMIDSIGDFESLIAQLNLAAAASPSVASARAPIRAVSARPMRSPVSTRASKGAARSSRMAMPDLDKLKEHAEALHDAIKGESEAKTACEAAAPHMKALHEEMGDQSPFYEDDDDDGDGEKSQALALVKELGGVAAARGVLAASKKTASRIEALEKEVAQAKADKEAAEVSALLDEAMLDGRLSGAAEREEATKLHAEIGTKGLRSYLAKLPKKPAAAREPAPTATAPAGTPTASAPMPVLSAEEIKLCAKLGMKPEDFAAHKAKYNAALGAPKQEE